MKLDSDVPYVKLYKRFSKNLIPPITLVSWQQKEKRKIKSLKIFMSETRRCRDLIFGV